MRIETDVEVSLFVRHQATGRLVFNPKAIEVLGLGPMELASRIPAGGYGCQLGRSRLTEEGLGAHHTVCWPLQRCR
jgi:hypothetical protein